MSENIRLTYIPYSSMDEGFYQSIVEIAECSDCMANPFILYNNELDINVENLDSIINKYTEYIDADELYDKINEIAKNESEGTIILYGFDISLDDIREDIIPLINENIYLSINVIVEDDNYACSSSISLPMSIADESDEEWSDHKEEIDDELKRIGVLYQKLNSLFKGLTNDGKSKKKTKQKELEAPKEVKLLECDIPSNKEKLTPTDKEQENIEDSELDENFVCYTYEDVSNIVSVVRSGNVFSIEDDDNRVEFDKKALDFIIEALMKFYDE